MPTKLFQKKYHEYTEPEEWCMNCQADLNKQKGYSNDLEYWQCKSCGVTQINPAVFPESDIVWRCDKCLAVLNIQGDFQKRFGKWDITEEGEWIGGEDTPWKCTQCGTVNIIGESQLFTSEEEYQADLHSPYKGLSDTQHIELLQYEELGTIGNREDIILVQDRESGHKFVKKILDIYDLSVYEYLLKHPIEHMPKLEKLYHGINNLIVLEEYIEGMNLEQILLEGPLETEIAVHIAMQLCTILNSLHTLDNPIIHRDIKPSNVIISKQGEVFLLDMNVAKWYDPDEIEDTTLLGTHYYAAPEQLGFGMQASTEKADIYSLGILFNQMLTGRFPKEEKAMQPLWEIIENCIRLEPAQRYSAAELCQILRSKSNYV